jgi:hypothetical protein
MRAGVRNRVGDKVVGKIWIVGVTVKGRIAGPASPAPEIDHAAPLHPA